MFNNNKLSKSVRLAIAFGAVATAIPATQVIAAEEEKEESIEKIEVTGSRIKRTDFEGPAPVISITAEDFANKGFTTAYDAIQSLSAATGSNQGQVFGGFTGNAETVNFRGLGPNRTLILLNGKRVANYPRAFNGQNNVFNLATIPFAAVERIDVVTGGQSAIYGSDAIAGVMNIITKKSVDETTVKVDGSITGEGGAGSRGFSVVTGGEVGGVEFVLGLEHNKQDMLRGKDRSWLDDRFDNPSKVSDFPSYAVVAPRSVMAMQFDGGWQYQDPGSEACAQWDDLAYEYRPNRGFYCGRDARGDGSLLNDRKNTSVYAKGTYDINNDHQVSLDVVFWNSDAIRENGAQFWSTDYVKDEIANSGFSAGNGYIYDVNTQKYSYFQRSFQPEERFGNGGFNQTKYDEQMLNVGLTFTGLVFEDYDYEAFVTYSKSSDKQSSYKIKKEVASDYYVTMTDAGPVFNYEKFWKPLDEAGFKEIFGNDYSESDSSVFTAGANITGDLYELPAGALAFSALVEYEKSEYDINVHPRMLGKVGEGFAGWTGTEGSGDRSRTAVALEFAIPVTEQFDVNAAVRYDYYNDETNVDGAPTFQLGLQYRPMEELLLRANWGTTFRAPDLHNVFKEPSGSYSSSTDYRLVASCEALAAGNTAGILFDNVNMDSLSKTCTEDFFSSYSTFNVSSGEKTLKEETGESLTVGFVWEPMDNLNVSLDYYKILMEEAVRSYPKDRLLRQERDCLNGTEDANSSLCQFSLNAVSRNGATGFNNSYEIEEVRVTFINAAMREQQGFDFTLDYKLETDYGIFGAKTEYSHILKTKNQWFIGDEIDEEYRDDYFNDEFRSKVTTQFSYEKEDWLLTLTQYRYGSLPNDVEDDDWTQVARKRYKPFFNYNLGINYSFNEDHAVRLGVNNVFNAKARADESETDYSYFDIFAYPSTAIIKGREFTLTYVGQF